MEIDKDLANLDKEVSLIRSVSNNCKNIVKTNGYNSLSLEQLADCYNNIENGLISYNIIKKRYSSKFKEIVNELDTWEFEKTLEAQLLSVAVAITLKDSSHLLSKMFKESLWNKKLKDRKYYEDILEYVGINEEYIENIYKFLHSENM